MTKTCDDFERLISDRLDGPIEARLDRELEEHLKECDGCSAFMASILQSRKQIAALPEFSESKTQPKTIHQRNIFRRRLSIPVPIAAVFALIALSGWLYALGMFHPFAERRNGSNTLVHSVEIIRADPVTAVQGTVDYQDSGKTEDIL